MNDIIQNDDETGAETTALKTARQLKIIKNFSTLVLIKICHRNVYSFDDRLLNLKKTKLVDKDAREKQSTHLQKKQFSQLDFSLSQKQQCKKNPRFWK